VRDLLTKYEFPGQDPGDPGVGEGGDGRWGKDAKANESILALMKAVDEYIPTPERQVTSRCCCGGGRVLDIGAGPVGRADGAGEGEGGDKVEIVGLRETRESV